MEMSGFEEEEASSVQVLRTVLLVVTIVSGFGSLLTTLLLRRCEAEQPSKHGATLARPNHHHHHHHAPADTCWRGSTTYAAPGQEYAFMRVGLKLSNCQDGEALNADDVREILSRVSQQQLDDYQTLLTDVRYDLDELRQLETSFT